MDKTCDTCCHFLFTEKLFGRKVYRCQRTRAFLDGKPCELYNKNLDKYDICLNCKHFPGGSEWELVCRKYYMFPKALGKACEDMEREV